MPDLPVHILMILDGWGISARTQGNAVALASTPFLDMLLAKAPHCQLGCSGHAVGLPEGTMGNSEVGHMNIGAGRRVLQDLVRINTAIEDKTFFANPALCQAMDDSRWPGYFSHQRNFIPQRPPIPYPPPPIRYHCKSGGQVLGHGQGYPMGSYPAGL